MRSNIDIFHIQKFLEENKYPDAYRISKEIYEYIQNTNTDIEDIFKRISKGEPWEYISSYVYFCNSKFFVSKDVLIPRIETEQLVYDTYEYIKNNDIKNVIDVGTGSGCISISLCKLVKENIPNSNVDVYATDISTKALEIAKKNELDILGSRYINWVNCNLIEDIDSLEGNTVLVCNLPYIPTKQYMGLDNSVKDYEPRIALDGGINGLYLYEDLFKQIEKKDINIKGIFLETEESIFKDTIELVKRYSPTFNVREIKDFFNRDRFLYITN